MLKKGGWRHIGHVIEFMRASWREQEPARILKMQGDTRKNFYDRTNEREQELYSLRESCDIWFWFWFGFGFGFGVFS